MLQFQEQISEVIIYIILLDIKKSTEANMHTVIVVFNENFIVDGAREAEVSGHSMATLQTLTDSAKMDNKTILGKAVWLSLQQKQKRSNATPKPTLQLLHICFCTNALKNNYLKVFF